MIEESKSLKIAQKVYKEADIERNFIIAPNKLFFTVITNPAVLNPFDIEFITADYMFDSLFLESELTAYLMASDPELASWNRKHHLRYLEDEMKWFIVTHKDVINLKVIEWSYIIKRKSMIDVQKHVDKSNESRAKDYFAKEICFDDFNILSKYVPVN